MKHRVGIAIKDKAFEKVICRARQTTARERTATLQVQGITHCATKSDLQVPNKSVSYGLPFLNNKFRIQENEIIKHAFPNNFSNKKKMKMSHIKDGGILIIS